MKYERKKQNLKPEIKENKAQKACKSLKKEVFYWQECIKK